MEFPKNTPIVLYDGPCTLCNKSVQWLYKRDKSGRFKFGAIQGSWAKEHVPEEFRKIDSVLFFDGENWKTKSGALLGIAYNLPWPWRMLTVFWIIPKFIRDFMYMNCSGRRYLVFGKGYCAMVPKDRFLDQ